MSDFFEEDEPVADVMAAFDTAEERGVTADDHVCMSVVDDAGRVLGHARVAPDLDEQGRQALRAVVKAAIRYQAERDAADPEAAAERGRRQQAAIERVRARTGLRGGE